MASPLQLAAVQTAIKKGKKAKLVISYAFTQRTETENKVIYANAIQPIGSYYDGSGIGCGLDLEEINILMPHILKVQASHPEFLNKVTAFFVDYEVIFNNNETESIELYISLEDDTKELSKSNLPLNIDDYLKYRFLRAHPFVASSIDMAAHFGMRYVLTDEVTEETAKKLKFELDEKANALFYGLKSDTEKTKQVASLLNISIFGKSQTDLLEAIQKSKTEDKRNFITILEDEDLLLKAMLKSAERNEIIRLVGNTYFLVEEGTELGLGIENTILFLKSKEGKESMTLIKGRTNKK